MAHHSCGAAGEGVVTLESSGTIAVGVDVLPPPNPLPWIPSPCFIANRRRIQKEIHKHTVTTVILVNRSPAFAPKALCPPPPPNAPTNPPPLPRWTKMSRIRKIDRMGNRIVKIGLRNARIIIDYPKYPFQLLTHVTLKYDNVKIPDQFGADSIVGFGIWKK
jgi:hypothetical protein